MPEAAWTTAGTIPSDTGRPGRRREVAAMGPKEAVWLARYMCILSLAFAALGLLLLVLVRRPRFGRATFFRRFSDLSVSESGSESTAP